MTPEEEQELAELEELERLEAEEAKSAPPSPDAVKAAELSPIIDPSVSVPAQVLSTQPATSNPKGDEAAQADWMVKGTKDGNTVVYEPPLAKAKQELLSNPQLISALFPDEEIPPEFIQNMDANSDIYKAYADHKWNDARWAAAESGTTAYRYSKAPWLQGKAAGMGPLETLATKAQGAVLPLLEGATAFLLGQDDTATLGAVRRGQEATDAGDEYRPPKPNDGKAYRWTAAGWVPADQKSKSLNIVGGAIAEGGGDVAKTNELLQQEYSGLHTGGQLAGLFNPAGVMGLLGKGGAAVVKGGGAAAARLGGGKVAQFTGKVAAAGGAAVAGGTAVQAGREGVEAASSLARTGEAGTTLGEAASRSVEAGTDPTNMFMGVGGEVAGMAAKGLAKGLAGLPRYAGNVERVEQLGGKIKFGKGPVGSEGAEQAIKLGKARDISPQDVIAERIAPKIAEAENAVASGNFAAAKAAKEEVKLGHAEFKEKYFSSREGQLVLPPVATLETNLKHLRSKVTEAGGKLRPIGNAEGIATARAEFSGDVARVSTKPVPGAIELTPEEAELFLAPSLTSKLVPRSKTAPPAPGGAPPPAPPKGGGTNPQGVNFLPAEAPTVPPKGKAAKPAGVVPKAQTRTNDTLPTPDAKAVYEEYGDAMKPHRDAQRQDNLRAEKLSKEFAGPDLAGAIKSTANKSGISTVTDVVKAMGGDRAAAHKALLEAEKRGAIELRPEGALKGRFTPEQEADMLPGPSKTKLNGIRVIDAKALGAAVAGAGITAASGDESGGAALASAGGLALALKKQGIAKVYAVPRRYNAQQHEVRIGQLQDLTKDPKAPGAREAKVRYQAALQDRDQRPLDGKPGGWSAKQQEISSHLTKLEEQIALAEAEAKRKGSAKRDAPGGTTASRLVRYSKQRPGELPLKKEIETAGKAAGVEGELQDLRLLDPLMQLRGAQAPRKASPGSKTGIIGTIADAMALRAAYPGLQSMGSDASPLRGGLLGTRALQLKKDEKEAR